MTLPYTFAEKHEASKAQRVQHFPPPQSPPDRENRKGPVHQATLTNVAQRPIWPKYNTAAASTADLQNLFGILPAVTQCKKKATK